MATKKNNGNDSEKDSAKDSTITWKNAPEAKHYQASHDFLSLIYPDAQVVVIVARLKANKISYFKAKDIMRASGLMPLPKSNANVEKNLEKIDDNIALTPVLLVRDSGHGKVIIADGYHRTSAVYHYDEDEIMACKITDLQNHETD